MGFRKRVTINLLATWGDHVIGLAIGLVLMPFVLRVLGDSQYGLWIFINSIAGYAGLFNLGLGATLNRYVSMHHATGDSEKLNRVVNLVGLIFLAMGTLALAIGGTLALLAPRLWPNISIPLGEFQLVIVILAMNATVSLVGSVFGGVLVGIQRFDLERGICVTSGLVRFVLTLVCLKEEFGLVTLALIFFTMTLVENLGLLWTAFRQVPELRLGRRFLHRETFHECFHFSKFSLLEVIAAKLIETMDCIVIGLIFGATAIVPYYVALRLCQFITKPLQYIGQVCLPRAGELHAKGQISDLQELTIRAMGLSLLFVTGFFIGAWFFGPVLIKTWVRKDYSESHLFLMVLLAGQLVGTPMKVISGVLFGMGDNRRPAQVYILEAFFNCGLTLTLTLIFDFGLLGVAMGSAIPLAFIELTLLLPFAVSKLQLSLRRLLTDVVGPQFLPLLALWGYSYWVWSEIPLIPGWARLLAIAGGGAATLIATWLVQRSGWQCWVRSRRISTPQISS